MSDHSSLPPILVACPDCDLLNNVPELAPGESGSCIRCDCTLSRNPKNSLQRVLALTLAAMILYALSYSFPFLSFGEAGIVTHTRLASGIIGLYREEMYFLAAAVSFTIVIVPVFSLAGFCYLLLPLHFNARLPGAERVLRWITHLEPWNMVEIFMIGIIVAGIKLAKMAALQPGLSFWSFMALIFILAWISAALEPRVLWEKLERARCL